MPFEIRNENRFLLEISNIPSKRKSHHKIELASPVRSNRGLILGVYQQLLKLLLWKYG